MIMKFAKINRKLKLKNLLRKLVLDDKVHKI